MLSYLPAALSFAVALAAPAPQNSPVSGTVGGGANASYASCPDQNAVCKSYGVDFHNGGSYFQDITSTDDFTFATVFTGKLDSRLKHFVQLINPSHRMPTC
jgi:hypothetical protein